MEAHSPPSITLPLEGNDVLNYGGFSNLNASLKYSEASSTG